MNDTTRNTASSHKIKPHVRNNRYFNNEQDGTKGFLAETIYMFFKNQLAQRKRCTQTSAAWLDKQVLHHDNQDHSHPLITWIGHSSFLIRANGITILTDPIFGNASFLYKRILPAGLLPHELPPIDVIILSHNHRDHMDEASLLALRHNEQMHILVPHGDKAWFDKRNFSNVQEFTWWEQTVLSIDRVCKDIRLTFMPAIHWSQRGLFDKNRSLWGSWMLEVGGTCMYFAGDTAYSSHFGAIAQEFPHIDIAFMPIGPCEPRYWMEHVHMSAQQAGQAFLDLKARHFIPMHWGTFLFGIDHFELPIEYLLTWWQQNRTALEGKIVHLLKAGKSYTIESSHQESRQEVKSPTELMF